MNLTPGDVGWREREEKVVNNTPSSTMYTPLVRYTVNRLVHTLCIILYMYMYVAWIYHQGLAP